MNASTVCVDNDKAGYEATRAIELEYPTVCVTSRTIIGIFGLERLSVRQEAGTEKRSQPSAGNEAGNRTTCRPKTKERQGHLIRQDHQRLAVYLESKVMFR